MEHWKAVERFGGVVEVSDKGRVRSNLRQNGYVLKTQTDKKGYHRVRMTIGTEKVSLKVHREVAKVFVPNPHNLPQVNHKNANKNDNSAANLEWVTNKENVNHAIANGLWRGVQEGARRENESRQRPIIGFYTDEDESCCRYFRSVAEAERFLDSRHICDVLKGKRKSAKGWRFEYAEGGEPRGSIDH